MIIYNQKETREHKRKGKNKNDDLGTGNEGFTSPWLHCYV